MHPAPTGVETDPSGTAPATAGSAAVAHQEIRLPWPHPRLIAVELRDQTDHRNGFISAREWLPHPVEPRRSFRGNLFAAEDTATRSGLVFVRRRPLPDARPDSSAAPPAADLEVLFERGPAVTVRLHAPPHETADGASPWTVLPYEGGAAGRARALHDWQRSLRPATPAHRIPRILSNTWGDRARDSRIRHDFILAEIEAAARLGVDVVQIDDGWQRGKSANSAFLKNPAPGAALSGFWRAMPDFWEVDAGRFPQGLAPLVSAARARGLEIGLWFAPDSDDDFVNWEKDAEVLLALHRGHGVVHFKIDGVDIASAVGLRRLQAFLARVAAGSAHAIVLDLDITAGRRLGYFGAIPAGPLFLENRYTDWGSYWPHHTLRALWELAWWIDPRRLRMEFLNPARNAALYGEDPLAPARHPGDYLFATVMFANPLGWFEVSGLGEDFVARARPLIAAWRAHREALFAGDITPLGEAPDGYAWTGFLSHRADARAGYALVFREFNADPESALALPVALPAGTRFEILGGEGGVLRVAGDGRLHARVPGRPGFVFARFTLP